MKQSSFQDGIVKTFMPHDFPGLVEEFGGHLTQLFERGCIKSAASNLFSRKDLDDFAPPPGYFMIHQIVMGSEEGYGDNSNHDSWPAAGLMRDHPTFVTHGHAFREHRNKSPDLRIGEIKAARFDPRMQRVETLKHIQIKKAEKEFQMAKEGKELHSSMASRVPFDICSICNNKAKFASLYCADLRDRMGQYDPRAQKYAFARNPGPNTFFDDSIVENPAARMAKHIEYRFGPELLKAAGEARPTFGGAQWAEFSQADSAGPLRLAHNDEKILRKLAALEGTPRDGYRKAATAWAYDPSQTLPYEQWQRVNALMPRTLFCKLAKHGVLLPFSHFCSYVTGQSVASITTDPEYVKSASMLPTVFRALADAMDSSDDCCCCGQDADDFRAGGNVAAECDPGNSDGIDKAMENAAEQFSTDDQPLQSRTIRIIVVKKAAAEPPIMPAVKAAALSPLLALYGLYKVAAVNDIMNARAGRREHHVLACAVDQNIAETV